MRPRIIRRALAKHAGTGRRRCRPSSGFSGRGTPCGPVPTGVVRCQPFRRGIGVRDARQGDGGLPQALARLETWPEAGQFGDVHAHVEQAMLHACREPDRAQRLEHAASAVTHHCQRRRDPRQQLRPCGAGLVSGYVPSDDMAVGDRDEHDRLPMQVDAVEVHHVMRRPVQRHRWP